MAQKYPALMTGDEGMRAVARGHGLTPEAIAEVNLAMLGEPSEDWFVAVEEVYFVFHPRLKWCERTTGWGCDNEGEWHGHWIEVQPNDDAETHFTVISHTDLDPNEIERVVE